MSKMFLFFSSVILITFFSSIIVFGQNQKVQVLTTEAKELVPSGKITATAVTSVVSQSVDAVLSADVAMEYVSEHNWLKEGTLALISDDDQKTVVQELFKDERNMLKFRPVTNTEKPFRSNVFVIYARYYIW